MKSETEIDSLVCDDKDRAELDVGFRVYKCANPNAQPVDLNKIIQDRIHVKRLIKTSDAQFDVAPDRDSDGAKKKKVKRSLRPKKKQSTQDKFWEVFCGFCISGNESSTYAELIDRVNFYNQNQTFLKKLPKSATPENACLLRFARNLFYSGPKETPNTQYDYLFYLVCKFSTFTNWLQDNFRFYHLDSAVDYILSKFKPFIPMRFKKISPEMSEIEELCELALGTSGLKGDLYCSAINKIDDWRKSNPENEETICKLHGLLDSDFSPRFKASDIAGITTESLIQTVYSEREAGKYDFTWRGKDICKMRAQVQDDANLIPDKEKSVNWDTTQNLYIEGDNLRALKALAPQYAGKVKMIYIDPPYNTGHDFVYKDNFRQETEIFDRYLFKPIPRTE
jgi:hypothetical protein